MDLATYLKHINVTSPDINGKRMCAVLTIFCFLDKTNLHLLKEVNQSEIAELMCMLRLKPGSHRHFIEFNHLTSFIPDNQYNTVSRFLIRFIEFILPTSVEWVNVVPVLHIFQNRIKPCEASGQSYKYNTIIWTEAGIDWSKLKKSVSTEVSKYVLAIRVRV